MVNLVWLCSKLFIWCHFSNILFYLFYFIFWLCWVFIAACGLSLVAASRGYSLLWCTGFSSLWLLLCWAPALGAQAPVAAARGLSNCGLWALEHRLCSCGARAQLLRSMWDLPRPGLEPVSPALAGGFLTTAPPGKSLKYFNEKFSLAINP